MKKAKIYIIGRIKYDINIHHFCIGITTFRIGFGCYWIPNPNKSHPMFWLQKLYLFFFKNPQSSDSPCLTLDLPSAENKITQKNMSISATLRPYVHTQNACNKTQLWPNISCIILLKNNEAENEVYLKYCATGLYESTWF